MLLLWILFVIYVSWLSLLCCLVRSLQPCDHLIGKEDLLALLCVVFSCALSLSHMVFRVRCGTWFIDSWSLLSSLLWYVVCDCGFPGHTHLPYVVCPSRPFYWYTHCTSLFYVRPKHPPQYASRSDALQWRSQNTEKVTHIKGRLLYQAMIPYNYVPFQNRNFSLRKEFAPRGSEIFPLRAFL